MFLIKKLRYQQGAFSLRADHVTLKTQGITLVKGPSGSGKSTLLKILLGLEVCQLLEWEFAGQRMDTLPIEKRNLGMVFQNLELFPHMSAIQNVKFAADCRKIPRDEFKVRVNELSDIFEINFWERSVTKLSGGQRQRVALARALVQNPQILFLDEPFSSFDQSLKTEGRLLIRKLEQIYKLPTVLVSHDAEDEGMASKVLVVSDGVLTEQSV